MPLGSLLGLPGAILEAAVGGQGHLGDARARRRGSDLGLAADVADEHDFVEGTAHEATLLWVALGREGRKVRVAGGFFRQQRSAVSRAFQRVGCLHSGQPSQVLKGQHKVFFHQPFDTQMPVRQAGG